MDDPLRKLSAAKKFLTSQGGLPYLSKLQGKVSHSLTNLGPLTVNAKIHHSSV